MTSLQDSQIIGDPCFTLDPSRCRACSLVINWPNIGGYPTQRNAGFPQEWIYAWLIGLVAASIAAGSLAASPALAFPAHAEGMAGFAGSAVLVRPFHPLKALRRLGLHLVTFGARTRSCLSLLGCRCFPVAGLVG